MEETRKLGCWSRKRLRFNCGVCQLQLRYSPIIQFKILHQPTLTSVMYTATVVTTNGQVN